MCGPLAAARIVPRLRARGVVGPRADVRALACAEGQFAALALWMQGGGVPAAVLAEELARWSAARPRQGNVPDAVGVRAVLGCAP